MADWSFDPQAILGPVSRATAKILPAAAEMTLAIARRLMAFRRDPSSPGSPPSARAGLLRRYMSWSWAGPDEVQAGPERLRNQSGYSVPEVLEFGGTIVRSENGKSLRQRFRARPYMRPAIEEAAGEYAEMWKDSVRP